MSKNVGGYTSDTVSAAISVGTRLDELIAVRKILAREIDSPETQAKELPPLVRQFISLTAEIHNLQAAAAEKQMDVDAEVRADADDSQEKWDPTDL